jgi:hypothetical protein
VNARGGIAVGAYSDDNPAVDSLERIGKELSIGAQIPDVSPTVTAIASQIATVTAQVTPILSEFALFALFSVLSKLSCVASQVTAVGPNFTCVAPNVPAIDLCALMAPAPANYWLSCGCRLGGSTHRNKCHCCRNHGHSPGFSYHMISPANFRRAQAARALNPVDVITMT